MSSGSHIGRGEKRSIGESSDFSESDNNQNNLIQLKKKCVELEERLQLLESLWIRK